MTKTSLFLCWLCLMTVAVALVGCADSRAKPDVRADENKEKMVGLKPEMTTEQVTNLMGPPDQIDRYRGKNNQAILIYLYITNHIETYTTRGWDKNNYTPFIFLNDRLIASGWHQLNLTAQRYEFVIRPPLAQASESVFRSILSERKGIAK